MGLECIKTDVAEINLNDCLACSGCVTTDELNGFKINNKWIEDKNILTSFIISPYSKIDLFQIYNNKKLDFINFENFEIFLINKIKEIFNVDFIIDWSYFKNDQNNIISSECPGVILYIERVYPNLLKYLSTNKTSQQLAYEYIKSKSQSRIVSIEQCYDKKNEVNKIDYIGTKEFYKLIFENENAENVNDSANADKIANAKNENSKIANAKNENSKIANAKNENSKIANAKIANAKIQNAKIQNAKIQNAKNENSKIANSKIQNAKIQNNFSYTLMPWEKLYRLNDLVNKNEILVSGLENVLNKMKFFNLDNKKYLLRLCKGGCINGLAQKNKNLEFINFIEKMPGSDIFINEKPNFIFKSDLRNFEKVKKTFSIDW